MLEDASSPVPVAPSDDNDRRAGRRHAIVLLVGRVCRGTQDSVCLVHDISRSGLMARFTSPPRIGERLCIEVRGPPPIAGTIRWVRDAKAGFEFDEAQDVDRIVGKAGEDGRVARTPRFPIRAAARLRFGEEPFSADLLDISPGGAKLASATVVEMGETGQILLPETGMAIYGTVCWTREGRFGFRFVTPLPLTTLSRILAG